VAELTGLNERMAAERSALEKQLAQTRQISEQSLAELADLKARLAAGAQAAQEQQTVVNQLGATNTSLQAQIQDLAVSSRRCGRTIRGWPRRAGR